MSDTTDVQGTRTADEGLQTVLIQVKGLHCAACVAKIEESVGRVPGVRDVAVNLAMGNARIAYHDNEGGLSRITEAVRRAGFEAILPERRSTVDEAYRRGDKTEDDVDLWKRRALLCAVLTAALLFTSMWDSLSVGLIGLANSTGTTVRIGLATMIGRISSLAVPLKVFWGASIYIFVGLPFVVRAVRQLRFANLSMDTLIALGVTAAFGHGLYQVFYEVPGRFVFLDVAMIAGFVSLGRFLELRSRRKASQAVSRLVSLTPPETIVLEKGQQTSRPISQVAVGDTILVRPGCRIPLDATVVHGISTADESWLTGESQTVSKAVGAPIYAGSLNLTGALTATVTASDDMTYLARVVDLVRKAQSSKASVQRFADRAAYWFVPLVLGIALITCLFWGLVDRDWNEAIHRSVAVVIVSCPCALGLATPTAIMAACQRGAQSGILIKDAQALETAGNVSCMLLDKTGTITHGPTKVLNAQSIDSEPDSATRLATRDWLRLAAAAEQHALHPLAEAIVLYAQTTKETTEKPLPMPTESETILGEGVTATVDGHEVVVGNLRLLRRAGVPIVECHEALSEKESVSGQQTLVHVAIDGRHVGLLTLKSAVDPHGRQAIKQLKSLGVVTMIVSGDNAIVSDEVGREIDVDHVISQARPDDKYELVLKMHTAGHCVAMVGDGVNDAPALAAADLGIAVGWGSDVALESADIVLTRSDVRQLPTVVRLAKAMRSTIRWNLGWAVGYNLCLIPLAAGLFIPLGQTIPWIGLAVGRFALPPWLAAAAMAASSVSVVSNSLRLATRTDI